MRLFKSSLLVGLAIMSLFWFSCTEDSKPKRKIKAKETKIDFTAPRSGAVYSYRDTIHFEVALKDKNKKLELLSLFVNDNLIAESTGPSLSFDYPIYGGPGGQLKIKAEAVYSDGTASRRRIGIKVNSHEEAKKMSYEVINNYPHDPTSFTQGLIYDTKEDVLFEGTGNYTESKLMKTKIGVEKAEYQIDIPDKYFGEGVTLMNDTVYQLSYKNKTGFYYNRDFELLGEFSYPTEGWGLTHNGENLIMSDGSANLYFINPQSFKIVKTLQVFNEKGQVYNLNELEYVDGVIYANIYTTDYIAKIDAKTGRLLALINMSGILKDEYRTGRIDVMNGIAFNPSFGSFYVTGKWWPQLFEVRFVD